jgi:LPS export ABC transporter protein LptC
MFTRKQFFLLFYYTVALVLGATVIVSCDTENMNLPTVDDEATTPTIQMEHLEVNYMEYGKKKMFLKAPVLERYMLAPEPHSIFPNGFLVEFFTTEEVLESRITAHYAMYKEKPAELWKAVGKVVVTNYVKNQRLLTDTLYWDRENRMIYTSAPVRVETEDAIVNGRYGMTSDEKFIDYEIRGVGGDSRYYFDDKKEGESDSLHVQQSTTVAP